MDTDRESREELLKYDSDDITTYIIDGDREHLPNDGDGAADNRRERGRE